MNNRNFYNTISTNYDQMIDFESSLLRKTVNFKKFILPHFQHSLDLGCGTGADSIALSRLGMKVDAVDHSLMMLKHAQDNVKRFDAEVNLIHSGLVEYQALKSYDFIVCMGNTMANISKLQIKKLLEKLKYLLNIKGKVLIQMINFAKLPTKGMYQINKFENEKISITRDYYIKGFDIEFVVKIIDKQFDREKEIRTKIYPYSKKELNNLALRYNLIPEFFGNLLKEPYLESESENLVILLSK